ncbi:MAG: tRNA (5-methylaminomethyl-2-thiouridine)(34)-methyltransferase MnmD, partial [Caulobacteraceae bacterium]
MSDDLDWTSSGPRSRRFDDVYFSAADGLAESRMVYLAGAGLPDAWRGRSRFTVGELGFGTGLNIAALLQLWRETRPADGRLSIFSVEAFPISRDAATRALAHWPELSEVTAPLLAGWPDGRRGFHRIDLPGLHASLDLCIGEAAEALAAWGGRANAWFLDGFAPSRNPEMWRDEVLELVAARSAPGAQIGTFTVAGQVRRGLAVAGFEVARRPGFGHKRERLEAVLP